MVFLAYCVYYFADTIPIFVAQLNSLSAACLTLTLVVYCAIPELRNLHGRNLICHVSMMLIAYTCLARVQYEYVSDKTLCAVLGELNKPFIVTEHRVEPPALCSVSSHM